MLNTILVDLQPNNERGVSTSERSVTILPLHLVSRREDAVHMSRYALSAIAKIDGSNLLVNGSAVDLIRAVTCLGVTLDQ